MIDVLINQDVESPIGGLDVFGGLIDAGLVGYIHLQPTYARWLGEIHGRAAISTYGIKTPSFAGNDAAAARRVSSRRPVMYTFAPFAAKPLAIMKATARMNKLTSNVIRGREGLAHIPLRPPVTRVTWLVRDMMLAMLS